MFSNLTTGELSTDVRLAPDGSFTGYVPVQEGKNRVRVSALASDGSRARRVRPRCSGRAASPTARRQLELERMREMNRELMLRREGEDVNRFREQQRKQLEIRREGDEAADDGGSPVAAARPGSVAEPAPGR